MDKVQEAQQRAAESLQRELAEVEVDRLRRWRKKKGKRYMYYWKCPCGEGMRYASDNAMRSASGIHRRECDEAGTIEQDK